MLIFLLFLVGETGLDGDRGPDGPPGIRIHGDVGDSGAPGRDAPRNGAVGLPGLSVRNDECFY